MFSCKIRQVIAFRSHLPPSMGARHILVKMIHPFYYCFGKPLLDGTHKEHICVLWCVLQQTLVGPEIQRYQPLLLYGAKVNATNPLLFSRMLLSGVKTMEQAISTGDPAKVSAHLNGMDKSSAFRQLIGCYGGRTFVWEPRPDDRGIFGMTVPILLAALQWHISCRNNTNVGSLSSASIPLRYVVVFCGTYIVGAPPYLVAFSLAAPLKWIGVWQSG